MHCIRAEHSPLLPSKLFRIFYGVQSVIDENLEHMDSDSGIVGSGIILSIIAVVTGAFDTIALIENGICEAWLERSQATAKVVLIVDPTQEPALQHMLDEAVKLPSRHNSTLLSRSCRRGQVSIALSGHEGSSMEKEEVFCGRLQGKYSAYDRIVAGIDEGRQFVEHASVNEECLKLIGNLCERCCLQLGRCGEESV